jgi:hypothetical protein
MPCEAFARRPLKAATLQNAKRAWKELAGFQGNFNDDWDEFVEDDDEQGLIDDMISERDKKSAGASQPERHLQTPQTAAGGSGVGMGQNTQDREEGARAAAAGVVEANGVNADGRGVARDGRGVSGAERMAALGQPAITAAASRGMVPRFDRNGPTSSWRQSPSHLQKDLCFDCPGCGEVCVHWFDADFGGEKCCATFRSIIYRCRSRVLVRTTHNDSERCS